MAKLPKDPITRKQWTPVRDKAGVKKGAVKKISLGDSLDKWHKVRTSTDSLPTLQKASAKLHSDAWTYAQVITQDKKGSAALGKYVTENIDGPADAWDKWCTAVVKDLQSAVIGVVNAYKVFRSADDAMHDTLVPPLDKLLAVLDTHQVGNFNNNYQQGIKNLRAFSKQLAAFDMNKPPAIDPISGAQRIVQALMKQNGLR